MIDMRALSGAAAGTDGDEARAAPSLTVTPDMIRGPASCSLGEDDSGGADPLRPRKGSGTPGHGTPSKYYFDGNPARGDGDGVHKESNQTRCDQPVIVALPSAAFDPEVPLSATTPPHPETTNDDVQTKRRADQASWREAEFWQESDDCCATILRAGVGRILTTNIRTSP